MYLAIGTNIYDQISKSDTKNTYPRQHTWRLLVALDILAGG